MRIIAGDIGGTKTLLQLVEIEGAAQTVIAETRFASGEYATFDDLLREFLGASGPNIDAANAQVRVLVPEVELTKENTLRRVVRFQIDLEPSKRAVGDRQIFGMRLKRSRSALVAAAAFPCR